MMERSKYVILKNRPLLEKGVILQDFVVIGKDGSQKAKRRTRIGENTRILTGAIVYNGCDIGKRCLIADHASVRENCVIGDDSVIGRHVCVEMNTRIGKHVQIATQTHITGNMIIEDYVFFGGNCTTTNDNLMVHPREFRTKLKYKLPFKGPIIRRGARIGSAACILPGIIIGEEAVIGAGAIVTKDVPPYTVVVGVPARELRKVPKDHLLQL